MSKNTTPNNFDFLRLVMAYFVLFGHQFKLTGNAIPGIDLHNPIGLRVLAFFSISGYLIAKSWERDPSAWRFLAKRVLRVWPGLVVVTIATAVLLGPFVSTLSLKDYFYSPQTWRFIRGLGTKIDYTLPGVFAENPAEPTVNGSLWTMRTELYCYLILLVFATVGLLRYRFIVLIGSLVLAVFVFAIYDFQHNPYQKYHFDLGAFFCYGLCLYYLQNFWSVRPKLILGILGVVSAVLVAIGYQYAALFLVLPPLVILFGLASTPFIRHAGRFGDFSYGIYLYGFPVQQTIIMLTGNRLSMWITLIISSVITVTLAILSWYLIERPALRLKRYLKQAKQAPSLSAP